MSRIESTICGDPGPPGDLNPYKVTKPGACQEILSLINQQPRALEEIARATKLSPEEVGRHLKVLAKAGLVKQLTVEHIVMQHLKRALSGRDQHRNKKRGN